MTSQQGPLRILHHTFVESGYVQKKLQCSGRAMISLIRFRRRLSLLIQPQLNPNSTQFQLNLNSTSSQSQPQSGPQP